MCTINVVVLVKNVYYACRVALSLVDMMLSYLLVSD